MDSEGDVDETMDLADDAAEKLLQSLHNTTSRNLGKIHEKIPFDEDEKEDPYTWMDDDEGDNDGDDAIMGETLLAEDETKVSSPKRRVIHRADTPIMSNTKRLRRIQAPLIVKRSLPSIHSTHQEYVRYHDALQAWRQGSDDERFLQRLQAQSSNHDMRESNFWLLLEYLRKGGDDLLLWNEAARADHQRAIANYVAKIAQQTCLAPSSIVEALSSSDAPAALRRRHCVLKWLEACFDHVLPPEAMKQYQTKPSGPSLQGLYVTPKDTEIFRNALALFLAGRLDDACRLALNGGVPWRAAMWAGGQPHDGDTGGNPSRALWRRMVWIRAERRFVNSDEETITALLASHLSQAFNTTSLDTWEKNLYAALRCGWDRLEDSVLHEHNNYRRLKRPPYPGTEFEEFEIQHLEATQDLATLDEAQAVEILEGVPEENLKVREPLLKATEQFLIGKNAVESLMGIADWYSSPQLLRFATHLAIYICYHQAEYATTRMVEWKNELVNEYLRFLASREDLWYTVVLYASLLPEETIMETLPSFLALVDNEDERKVILEQMNQFLVSRPFLVNDVLIKTIDFVINEDYEEEAMDEEDYGETVQRKMSSILWLCVDSKHAGDAMIASNALLRQFLLKDQLVSATELVDTVVPPSLLETVFDIMEQDQVSDVEIKFAYAEFQAYSAWLHAMKSFEIFREKLSNAAVLPVVPSLNDKFRLHPTERAVAVAQEQRAYFLATRELMSSVAVAAEDVLKMLRSVFEHPGGFLSADEGEHAVDGKRIGEMEDLRNRLLPQAIQAYNNVCLQTATVVLRLIQDAATKNNIKTLQEALNKLDESGAASTPMAPFYWAQQAVNLHALLVNDSYGIYTSLKPHDAETVAELAVQANLLAAEYEGVLEAHVLVRLEEE